MIMIKVDDKEEEKIGYVLFYPSKDKTFLIEKDYGATDQKSMDILKQTICEIMYAIHKKQDPQKETD